MLREKGVGDHCAAWHKKQAEEEMHYRDRIVMKQFEERQAIPRAKQLWMRIREMALAFPRGTEDDPFPSIPADLGMRAALLLFEWRSEVGPVPSEKVQQRWVRYGLHPLDAEYLEQNELDLLQKDAPACDQWIEVCKAGGMTRSDPHFFELCTLRRKRRRNLRRLQSRLLATSAGEQVKK